MSDFEFHKRNIERHLERIEREEKEALKKPNKPKQIKKEIIRHPTEKAFFLGDDFGREIHKKVIEKYRQFEAISKVVYDEGEKVVKGSTPFYVSALNEFLPENIRTASQADLERILKNNELELKGHYEDTSLVLRSNKEPNKYLAQDLYKQFGSRGISIKEGIPIVIPLFSLRPRIDDSSPYKLAFDLLDSLEYFEAPILNEASQRSTGSSQRLD